MSVTWAESYSLREWIYQACLSMETWRLTDRQGPLSFTYTPGMRKLCTEQSTKPFHLTSLCHRAHIKDKWPKWEATSIAALGWNVGLGGVVSLPLSMEQGTANWPTEGQGWSSEERPTLVELMNSLSWPKDFPFWSSFHLNSQQAYAICISFLWLLHQITISWEF